MSEAVPAYAFNLEIYERYRSHLKAMHFCFFYAVTVEEDNSYNFLLVFFCFFCKTLFFRVKQ